MQSNNSILPLTHKSEAIKPEDVTCSQYSRCIVTMGRCEFPQCLFMSGNEVGNNHKLQLGLAGRRCETQLFTVDLFLN